MHLPHKEMKEKWHHLRIDWLPVRLTFTVPLRPPTGNECSITAKRKSIYKCTTKTGRGIVFPGHYPQVNMEHLEKMWKLYIAKEKEPRWWRRQRRWRGRKGQEWTQGHSLNGERWYFIKVVSLLMCVPPYQQDLRLFKTTWLLIDTSGCFTLPFHDTEIWAARPKVDSYCCFFSLNSSQASGSHAANTVFVTAAPTVIPRGSLKGGKMKHEMSSSVASYIRDHFYEIFKIFGPPLELVLL